MSLAIRLPAPKRSRLLPTATALAGFCAAAALPAAADVVNEIESNGTRLTATRIPFAAFTTPPPANVFGSLPTATLVGNGGGADVDFFSFDGLAGERVYFDVDNTPFAFDTILSLFRSNGTLLALSDESAPPDPGSASSNDSFLGVLTLPSTETYFLAVTTFVNFPTAFFQGSFTSLGLRRPDGAFGGFLATGGQTPGRDTFIANGPPGNLRYQVQFSRNFAIPEPGTLALLGTGLLPLAGAVVRRKRRHSV